MELVSSPLVQGNQIDISQIFKNIEEVNRKAIETIKTDIEKFDEKAKKIIKFIQFRNKVDKLQIAYNLMIGEKKIKEINELTEKTEERLFNEALKKSHGDEWKAISVLFDDSSDVSF